MLSDPNGAVYGKVSAHLRSGHKQIPCNSLLRLQTARSS